MNKTHALTAENLLAALPQAIREDERVCALASAAAEVLASRSAEIDSIRIYPRIDDLPEELLDILAYDFKVDWWDYRYTVEQKRQTLKDSFLVHKRLGTKYAVKTALSAIYPNSSVQEWFEYGGEPYTFRLLINVSNQLVNPELYFRAIDLTNYYKNLRSHLRGVEYIIEAKEAAVLRIGGQFATIVKLRIPEIPDEFLFDDTARIAGHGSKISTLPIPEIPDDLRFESETHIAGHGSKISTVPIPELPDDLRFESEARVAGHGSKIATVPIPAVSDEFLFHNTARIGGHSAAITKLPIPAIPDAISLESDLRVGGRGATISSIILPIIPDET